MKGRQFIVGNQITLADVFVGSVIQTPMQLYIDPGFRKTIPNVESWFTAYVKDSRVASALGHVKLCTKALNPATETAKPQQ